jgi:dihydrolipoamide dehydrogenase
MQTASAKVLVLGGGPGGYVAAIRAGQLGLDTILVERADLGGTCLNIGCIPSKALIHAADEFHRALHFTETSPLGIRVGGVSLDFDATQAWKAGIVERLTQGVGGLLRRAKVRVVSGDGRMLDGKTCMVETPAGQVHVTAEHIVLATGSEPVALADLAFGGPILSSTDALGLTELPAQLAVVGAGYIGLELGTAFAKLGVKVDVVMHADAELTKPVATRLAALGIGVHLGARALRYELAERSLVVAAPGGPERRIAADKVLVTVGRRARLEGWGLENLMLEMSGQMSGRAIRIDEQCRTSMRHVWAIGDVTGEPMLAHRAMAQGRMVAEIIAGHKRAFDTVAMPAVCYTDPEVVVVGLAPDDAKARGADIVTGVCPFSANGRALTMADNAGFVRIVARRADHVVLGIQAVGRGVSELAAGFALALEMGARLEDIAATVHAHPTQSEAVQEAALKALGAALHA